MEKLIIALTAGIIIGGLLRPGFDDAYWEWRYLAYTPCELAEIAPTDGNIEACTGQSLDEILGAPIAADPMV
jgi:hypothetical protein